MRVSPEQCSQGAQGDSVTYVKITKKKSKNNNTHLAKYNKISSESVREAL